MNRAPITFLIGVAVCACYFVSGKVGLGLAYVNPSVSAVWVPTGIALAAFLVLGRRAWPAVMAGAFLVNVTTTGSIATSIAISTGNTLEGAVGAYLVTAYAGGRATFGSPLTIFRFTALIGLVAAPISATVGVAALALSGLASWSDVAMIWTTWWLGDLSGALVVTPLVVLWCERPFGRRWVEIAEGLLLLALLVPTAGLVFAGVLPVADAHYPLEFLCVPFFLWAAFRLGRREAATVMGIMAVISVWGLEHGHGPFARPKPTESFLLLQSFTGMWAIVSVVLAAVVSERRQTETESRALAITDPLTGLANLRRLNEVLAAEVARSARTYRPFAVLFIDLNRLKEINDRHGHLTGNQALRRVADVLRVVCRETDTIARFGGDEFVAVLPETDEAGGQMVARRIAEHVATQSARPPLSISTGLALYPRDGVTPATLLAAADGVLYQVKHSQPGRRRWQATAAGRP